jgi:NAD/NADP transhydrogenase beta subunit
LSAILEDAIHIYESISTRKIAAAMIIGMLVVDTNAARRLLVLKHSVNSGIAKIEIELLVRSSTMLLSGNARESLIELIQALKDQC